MDAQTNKRKFAGGANGPHKAPKMGGGGGGGGGMSKFAQKMMSKMGWQEGQGLGKEGEGIAAPIEVKLRPQGAGVGTVKERTEQYKQEQRRAAERRGEEYEDSSDEERKRRKERQKKSRSGLGGVTSGTSTPGGQPRKQKTKYRSIADVQAAAPGLHVPPQMLSSIVDATGTQTKLLTSAAGLMVAAGTSTDSEADKIAKRERMELEAFLEAWHGIQEQKVFIEEQSGRHQIEVDQQRDEVEKLQAIVEAVENLKLTTATGSSTDNSRSMWSILVDKIEAIQTDHKHDVERFGLSEAAIGALSPLFKKEMANWDPLADPAILVDDLQRIRTMLGLPSFDEVTNVREAARFDESYGRSRRQKETMTYATMMYTIWLPKLRTTITNWDVLNHAPLTSLVHAWRPLLPPFIYSNLIDQLIVPRLTGALQAWDPRKRSHNHKTITVKYAQPHTWLFPWLPYLPPYQLDPKASTGLLIETKRRLRQVLDGWDIASGILAGLQEWRDLLGAELDHVYVRHLLPKLARHLSQNFEVDPSDQDLTPLEKVLAWQDHFKTEVFARLLAAEFFPKWLATLHMWLTSDEANLEEVGQWFTWWKQQIPAKLNAHSDIDAQWEKGTAMINQAMDLLDEGRSLGELAVPAAGPARPIAKELTKKMEAQATAAQQKTAPSELVQDFKDIVEAWCAEEDLTMVPMREAHPQNGLPLFRITASATGKGGVVVFLKGDIVWAQKKGDRSVFDPLGLDERLVERAEGK
ncbi:G-patch domain-containing protein [Fulvia fulva]|nr:G-patch domain-containing protein [Fulvia fulva]WPV15218.1 G-patch domain-containing protein [Fulvia fulva]WPV30202.1 G-patch domain-containing protein [Fulvia fulva]